MGNFKYRAEHLRRLSEADPVLGRFIGAAGRVKRKLEDEPFAGLVKSVIGQQVSSAAAYSVARRVELRFGGFSEELLARASVGDLAGCGMSLKKAQCIIEAAQKFSGGQGFGQICRLPDESLCAELVKLRGVGLWTAQMVMIFSLNRMNVLSGADYGIRAGMARLYGCDATKEFIEGKRSLWSPYCSVASLYMWEAAGKRWDGKDFSEFR